MPIFSRLALSFFDPAKHGIQSVSRIGKIHFHRDHRERLERGKVGSEINRIFFGGNEATGLAPLFQVEQFANVFFRVGVVIAIKRLGDRFDIGRPQLQHEVLRSRDTAEDHRARRNIMARAAFLSGAVDPPRPAA